MSWFLKSVTSEKSYTDAKTEWGLTNCGQYIYDLSGAPIADGAPLTASNWRKIDTTIDASLNPLVAYWVKGELASGDSGSGGSGSSAAAFNKLVVAGQPGGGATKNLWFSDDAGLTWTGQTISADFGFSNGTVDFIAYGNGTYVAVGKSTGGSTPANAIYSTDGGQTWTGLPTSPSSGNANAFVEEANGIVYANNLFVACEVGHGLKYSTDGINWTYGAYTEDGNGGNYGNGTYYEAQSVDYVNNTFVALIRVTTGLKLDTSTDGMNWIRTSTILTGLAWSPSCVGTAYGNGKYLAYGAGSDNMAMSSDLENWTYYPGYFGYDARGAAYGNGTWVVVGNYADNSNRLNVAYSTDDGNTWNMVKVGTGVGVSGVTFHNDTFILSIQDYSSNIYSSTDGITWTQGSGNGQNDDNVPWMLDGTIVESFVV
jgi:hypothetical protein